MLLHLLWHRPCHKEDSQNKGGDIMKEYIVFVHEPATAMVSKVEIIRAPSRRKARRILRRLGFKKRKF
jgi:hypothetical protein